MNLSLGHILTKGLADCVRRCGEALGALARAAEARVRVAQGAARLDAHLVSARVLELIVVVHARLQALLYPARRRAQAAAAAPEPAARAERDRAEREDHDPRPRPRDRLPRDRRPLPVIIADICTRLGFSPEAAGEALAPFLDLEALLAGAAPAPAVVASVPPVASAWRSPPPRLTRRQRRAAARAARRDPRGPP